MQMTLDNFEPYRYLDAMMWVGEKYYTIEAFLKEAFRYGACKRFGAKKGVPLDLGVGKSRIFLVHDVREEDKKNLHEWRKAKRRWKRAKEKAETANEPFEEPEPQKPELIPKVFAYFTMHILVVGAKKAQELIEQGEIQVISASSAASFEKRGCGRLRLGGCYFVSSEDMEKIQEHADMAKGDISLIDPPISYPGFKRFRGYKYVFGDRILAGDPSQEWFEVEEIRKENATIRKVLEEAMPVEGNKKVNVDGS